MAPDRLNAGDEMNGRYRLERELGRGGMSRVWLARNLRHGTAVVLKILRPQLALTLGSEQFLREIEFISRLNHRHILPLVDSGEMDGMPFFATPYIEGDSLATRLGRERQLPLDDAVAIACEVAEALAHAHANGVIHRDIKPDNILLGEGHAVVADFGVAKAVSAAVSPNDTSGSLVVGTPVYMSPEQAAGGRAVDGRSDLYSLGCVLYEMLAGEPPFSGPNAETVCRKHLAAGMPPLATIRPGIPRYVRAVVERALAKRPNDRFPDAPAMARALEECRTKLAAASSRRHWLGTFTSGAGAAVAALLGG